MMINRYRVLFLFLLVVPFFNIIGHRMGNGPVAGFIAFFVFFNLIFLSKQRVFSKILPSLLFVLFLGILLFFSELHSVLNLNKSNFTPIRFFGLFIPVLLFYILIYDPRVFLDKYYDKILYLYILFFSLSILIDYAILHSSLDLSLQPMYGDDFHSYFDRPFGITGQPSVNSVLLVFFYCLILSRHKVGETKFFFFMVSIGVVFQGSGSGFVAYCMLLFQISRNLSPFLRFSVGTITLVTMWWLLQEVDFFSKLARGLNSRYVEGLIEVFQSQIDDWIELIDDSMLVLHVLFGGVSSNIDFGPLYLLSNTGLLYTLSFLGFIFMLIFKAESSYERLAFYVILVGNLHYPVMFYAIMAFFLPLLIHKIIAVSCSESLKNMQPLPVTPRKFRSVLSSFKNPVF